MMTIFFQKKHGFICWDMLIRKITASGRQIIHSFSKKLRYIQLKLASGAQFLNIKSLVHFFFYKTTDSDVYTKIIQDYFIVLLEEDEWYAWFQQYGATAHMVEKMMPNFSQMELYPKAGDW